MSNLIKKRTGFTLIELLISVSLVSLVFLAVTSVDIASRNFSKPAHIQARVQEEATFVMEHMVRNIRRGYDIQADASSVRVEIAQSPSTKIGYRLIDGEFRYYKPVEDSGWGWGGWIYEILSTDTSPDTNPIYVSNVDFSSYDPVAAPNFLPMTLTATDGSQTITLTSAVALRNMTPSGGGIPGTVVVQISHTDQDGIEVPTDLPPWKHDGDAGNQVFFGKWSARDLNSGYVFTNITIPPGSTITSAFISVYRSDYFGVNVFTKIKGFAQNNAPVFLADGSNRPSTRPKTAMATWIDWDISSWSGWNNSPDISGVIEEIVNRPGWSSGNNLGLVVENDGTAVNAYAASFDYFIDITNPTTLTVNYTSP